MLASSCLFLFLCFAQSLTSLSSFRTCLIERFLYDRFSSITSMTVGSAFGAKTVVIDGSLSRSLSFSLLFLLILFSCISSLSTASLLHLSFFLSPASSCPFTFPFAFLLPSLLFLSFFFQELDTTWASGYPASVFRNPTFNFLFHCCVFFRT